MMFIDKSIAISGNIQSLFDIQTQISPISPVNFYTRKILSPTFVIISNRMPSSHHFI